MSQRDIIWRTAVAVAHLRYGSHDHFELIAELMCCGREQFALRCEGRGESLTSDAKPGGCSAYHNDLSYRGITTTRCSTRPITALPSHLVRDASEDDAQTTALTAQLAQDSRDTIMTGNMLHWLAGQKPLEGDSGADYG
jgi:hypothetical protein